MLQSGSPSKCNVFCVAKVWCESIYFRYTFATLLFEFQLYRPNAPADIDFDNLLTPTLKSDRTKKVSHYDGSFGYTHWVQISQFSFAIIVSKKKR